MAAWFDEVGYDVDIAAVRAVYPGLRDFAEFVVEARLAPGRIYLVARAPSVTVAPRALLDRNMAGVGPS